MPRAEDPPLWVGGSVEGSQKPDERSAGGRGRQITEGNIEVNRENVTGMCDDKMGRSMFALRRAVGAGVVGVACTAFFFLSACRKLPTEPALSADDLKQYVSLLASSDFEGREAGTPTGRRAVDAVAAEYKRNGLVPAFADSYTQEFPFSAGLVSKAAFQWTIPPSLPRGEESFWARVKRFFRKSKSTDAVSLPFSDPSAVTGPAVFLGFCLRQPAWDDFGTRDVKGKILFCLRHGPGGKENRDLLPKIGFEAKYEAARQAGAIGVVFIGGHGEPVDSSDFRITHKPGPPAVFIPDEEIFTQWPLLKSIEAELRDKKPSAYVGQHLGVVSLASDYITDDRKGYNVGARLRGGEGKRLIIVGAHVDHIGRGSFSSLRGRGDVHSGADDNASGVAVTMEVAAKAADDFKHGLLKLPDDVDILFLNFDAEERGLYGSIAFAKSAFFSPEKTIAVVNLDMVGRLRKDKGLSVQGADTADESWRKIVQESFQASQFPDGIDLRFIDGGRGPSDHTSFYERGVPVAFLYTGGHKEYHTPDDTSSLINADGLLCVSRMTYGLVQRLAARGSLSYRRAAREPERGAFEFSVRLGIVPGAYSSGGSGLEVGGVLDHAPVAKTGIKTGDKIVMIGTHEIKNIHDLMAFLSDARLNTKYKIVFLRGTQRIEAETELMPAK